MSAETKQRLVRAAEYLLATSNVNDRPTGDAVLILWSAAL